MSMQEFAAGMSVVDLLIEKLYSAPRRHEEVMQIALGEKNDIIT